MLYQKQVYLKNGEGYVKAIVRNYESKDFEGLIQIQAESFPPPFPSELWWNQEQLENHVTLFPEGALCVEINGTLAGSMTGLVVDFDPNHPSHTWEEITDNGYIRNHNPNGNTLYIVDVCIRPSFRGLALGKLLMQSMYGVVIHKNLERLLGGGRMPGYHKHASVMSAEQYLQRVVEGSIHDPVISFMLRAGRTPIGVVPDYLEDEESVNYAALMEWKNPFKDIGGMEMDVRFPIGKLQVPEKVTLENIHEWLKEIESYTDRLRKTVDQLDHGELNKTYRDGSWNVRQLVHHIADSQLNMYQRLKLALTDDSPTVPAFDEEKWAIQPDTKLSVESSIKMLEGINERIVSLGSSLTEKQLGRSFIHQTNGEITVATKLAKLAWHEEHHLAHIKIALSK